MLRPRGSPRQSHSKGNMATSYRIWRCKSSKRRAEVKLTPYPPPRPLCTPAQQNSRALWQLPTTFYWDRHLHHLYLSYCRGLPQWKNNLLQPLLPHQCPSSLLGPKMAPFPRSCGEHAFGWNHFEGNSGRTPPAPSSKKSHPGTEHSSRAMLRHLAETLTW